MAILPQHITQALTTLIRESFPPLHQGCFDARNAMGEELFKVVRQITSLSRRREIIDAKTGGTLLTIRRDIGSLRCSYYLENPGDNKILELQGKFYVPFRGSRSTAAFVNAVAGEKVELLMQGSWLKRNVRIVERATDYVVARTKREILTSRNAVGGRTSYTASVEAGVDLTIVLGLILALDERAD